MDCGGDARDRAIDLSVFAVTRTRFRDLAARELEDRARAQTYLVQLLSGIESLKAQGVERVAAERWSHLFVGELNSSLERGRVSVGVEAVRSALRTFGPLAVLTVGALQVLGGDLSLGSMLALAAVASSFLGPLDELVHHALQLQILGSHIERIDDVLRESVETQGPPEARPLCGATCDCRGSPSPTAPTPLPWSTASTSTFPPAPP